MRIWTRPLAAMAIMCSVAAASWLTFGGDQHRDGWAREETAITPQSARGFHLLWKVKLDNQPVQLNSLTSPVVINPVYTNRGAETYVAIAGSSDNLFIVDADTGKVVWQKHFANQAKLPSNAQVSYFCPNALNDTPVIGQDAAGPTVYVISSDGQLHALNLVDGEDRFPPKQFVPPFSKNWSLNLSGGVIYTTISQGCGLAKSGVWAMDVTKPDKPVTSFVSAPTGAGIWGRGGASLGNKDTVFASTGDGPVDPANGKYADTVLALSARDLKLLDYFTPRNANYLTRKDLDMGNNTPIVFDYKGRELLVGSGKEGKLFLLDAKSLGGQNHQTPLFESPRYVNQGADIAGRGFWGAFASWQDPGGARWVYAPAWGPLASDAGAVANSDGPAPDGSIMAFKVEEKNGQPVLTPQWVSHNMSVPEPPVIANGVVLALSSGEFVRQFDDHGHLYTAEERVQHSTGNATLYAFDASTGKEIFSSGKTMSSFTHFGSLAVSDGRVFASTHDGTLYAFSVEQD